MKTIALFVRHTIALLAAIMAIGAGLATAANLLREEWRSAALGAFVTVVWALVANAAGRSSRRRHARAAPATWDTSR